jgi:hypothetical protein
MSEKVVKPLSKSAPLLKPPSLTFSDGLNFGCGFWTAGFLFFVVALPVGAVILTVILGALGNAIGGN